MPNFSYSKICYSIYYILHVFLACFVFITIDVIYRGSPSPQVMGAIRAHVAVL